jgi:hypothetical protein
MKFPQNVEVWNRAIGGQSRNPARDPGKRKFYHAQARRFRSQKTTGRWLINFGEAPIADDF